MCDLTKYFGSVHLKVKGSKYLMLHLHHRYATKTWICVVYGLLHDHGCDA